MVKERPGGLPLRPAPRQSKASTLYLRDTTDANAVHVSWDACHPWCRTRSSPGPGKMVYRSRAPFTSAQPSVSECGIGVAQLSEYGGNSTSSLWSRRTVYCWMSVSHVSRGRATLSAGSTTARAAVFWDGAYHFFPMEVQFTDSQRRKAHRDLLSGNGLVRHRLGRRR